VDLLYQRVSQLLVLIYGKKKEEEDLDFSIWGPTLCIK